MNEKKIILGIETSCDETGVSIIEEDKNGKIKILSNVVSSQFDIHKEFGGVVPELAARSHVEKIDLITKKAINDSGVNLNDVSAIASIDSLYLPAPHIVQVLDAESAYLPAIHTKQSDMLSCMFTSEASSSKYLPASQLKQSSIES